MVKPGSKTRPKVHLHNMECLPPPSQKDTKEATRTGYNRAVGFTHTPSFGTNKVKGCKKLYPNPGSDECCVAGNIGIRMCTSRSCLTLHWTNMYVQSVNRIILCYRISQIGLTLVFHFSHPSVNYTTVKYLPSSTSNRFHKRFRQAIQYFNTFCIRNESR